MVKIENLTKNYGDFNLNVSLEIPKGTITGLIGKNGAGKSTTIKAILGLIKADSGTIEVLGKNASKLSSKDRELMGVTLSEAGFSGYLTVKDIAAVLDKMYREFDKKSFLKECEAQRLPLDKTIKDFSTGMKAKVRVLVALSHKARLLIMDEPTAGLDVEARNEILDMMRTYISRDEECAILITSHISTDLENLCDDIYLIHEGRVMLHEETDVILSQYGLLKVSDEAYKKLDKDYIISEKKESYGYACFTNQKKYYLENYPEIVVENGNIDELILMMTGGK